MPEHQRYLTRVEVRVTVDTVALSGGTVTVGEYVVRGEAPGVSTATNPVSDMVEAAMVRVSKAAKVMAAGVDNTERNRRK